MKNIYYLVFFILPLNISAQNVDLLKEKKGKFLAKVQVLQDSIDSIEQKIENLEEKKSVDDNIEVPPTIPEVKVLKDTILVANPLDKAEPVIGVEKGAILLKVDEIKDFFLTCISGECGYIRKELVHDAEDLETVGNRKNL